MIHLLQNYLQQFFVQNNYIQNFILDTLYKSRNISTNILTQHLYFVIIYRIPFSPNKRTLSYIHAYLHKSVMPLSHDRMFASVHRRIISGYTLVK